tara:strand:- start:410 stop:694 length:285 start_codon:yes stop_codon:yes gene_type:complete
MTDLLMLRRKLNPNSHWSYVRLTAGWYPTSVTVPGRAGASVKSILVCKWLTKDKDFLNATVKGVANLGYVLKGDLNHIVTGQTRNHLRVQPRPL